MSTPFFEMGFPERIARGAMLVLRTQTRITTAGGGAERRNKRRRPWREWDATRGIRQTADYELVRNFRLIVGGRHGGFRMRDFSDYLIENQTIDTSAGGTTFQIVKDYTFGDYTFTRTITKPAPGSLLLELNDLPVHQQDSAPVFGETLFGEVESDITATVDYTTGIITTSSALSAVDVLTIRRCEFDVPARFASDSFEVSAHSRGKNWEYGSILIKELV